MDWKPWIKAWEGKLSKPSWGRIREVYESSRVDDNHVKITTFSILYFCFWQYTYTYKQCNQCNQCNRIQSDTNTHTSNTHMHTSNRTYIHACKHAYLQAYKHTSIQAYIHSNTNTYTNMHTNLCTNACTIVRIACSYSLVWLFVYAQPARSLNGNGRNDNIKPLM